jgi:beta-glucuronidase
VVTDLDGATGVVDYTIEAEGAGDLQTGVMLRDADGQEVATETGPSGTMHIPNVHKWVPGDSYLMSSSSS